MQPETFLHTVENQSGLLLEQNPGSYGFAHKTFQEYLAAMHCQARKLEQELISHIGDSWWHETLRLYCAQNDATNIIETCLSQANTSVEVLMLAIECNEEKLEAQPSVDTQIKELLDKGCEEPDPQRRRVVAKALLNRRLQQMVYLHDEAYVDTSLVTCAEYQLFLDEQLTQGYRYQPLHWQAKAFAPGQGHKPILGIQPRDAFTFCDWLNQPGAGPWYYRLPNKEEYEQIRVLMSKSGKLKANTGYWFGDYGHEEFAWASEGVPECSELEQMLQSILDNDLKQADTFNHIRSNSQKQILDQVLALEQELDRMHTPAFNLQWAHDLYHARALNFDQLYELSRMVAHDKTKQSLIKQPEERALIATLPTVIFQIVSRLSDTASLDESESALLRWCIRYTLQHLARIMDNSEKQARNLWSFAPPSSSAPLPSPDYHKYREIYTRIYIGFAILELRMQGQLPPWEGLLIVKERRKQ